MVHLETRPRSWWSRAVSSGMLEMDSGDSRPPRAARALLAVALLDGLASGSNAAGCFADRSAAVGSATEQQRAWRVGRRPDASWTLGLDWASGDCERGFERLTTRPARAPLDGCPAVAQSWRRWGERAARCAARPPTRALHAPPERRRGDRAASCAARPPTRAPHAPPERRRSDRAASCAARPPTRALHAPRERRRGDRVAVAN